MNIYSKEFDQDIINNYPRHGSQFIVDKYKCTKLRVYNVAKRLGVKFNPELRWNEDKNQIIKDYISGYTFDQLGAKYHYYEVDIKNKLVSWGIHVRSVSECATKYEFNKNYFKTIDTEEKAYWLGFICADGNVYYGNDKSPRKRVFQIALAPKDRKHLELLNTAIGSTRPIYTDRGNARLMIPSQEFVEDLANLGVHPRKSLNLIFPSEEILPRQFRRSFILGYFDGDGSISSYTAPRRRQWSFQIVGTENMLSHILEIFHQNGINKTKLTPEKRSKEGKVFYLCKGGTIKYTDKNISLRNFDLERLYKFLYGDLRHNIFLGRKKEKFELYIEERYGKNWKSIIEIL